MTGAELDRAAAAAFQAGGWFVLRGATDETFQAFELEVVGYRFDGGSEASVASSPKGGVAGLSMTAMLRGLPSGRDRGPLVCGG